MVHNYETEVCLYRICSLFYKHTMKLSTLLFSDKSFIISKYVHRVEQYAPWMHVHLESQNVTLFEDTVFIDVISWDHTRLGWDLKPEWCSYKKREHAEVYTEGGHVTTETETGVMPTTNQGMPRTSSNHWKWGEKHGTHSPSVPPEGTNPADTSILEFRSPELLGNKFLLSSATQFVELCYGSHRKLIQYA